MAILYTTTGLVVETHPQRGDAFTHAEVLTLADGYRQRVPQPVWSMDHEFWDEHVILVDEDICLKPSPQETFAATARCKQQLIGSALVLTRSEWEVAMTAPDVGEQDV